MRNRARCSRVGLEATKRFFEFFTVPIRNKNTRIAYYHAIGQFLDWRQKAGFRHLEDIEPIHVAAYIEGHSGSAATIKQHRLNSNNAEITGSARVLVPLLEFNQSTISLKKAELVYDLPAIDTYAKYRANVTPAPVSIVDRGTFCLMDLSRVGYVISICEYDERGKVVLRPDFRGQRLNLYFRDLIDGVGIATEADIEKTCKFSAKWALAARKDPEKAPLVVHCAAGISRSTAIAMIPLIAYYESVHLAARRLYQIREFAQPNTHVLYLIHQTLSLEENIYEILFQAQNPGLFD